MRERRTFLGDAPVIRRFALACALFLGVPSLPAQIPEAEYARRREALAQRTGDGVILALGAPEPAHDYVTFHQSSPFFYLTGFREPEAALVIVKRGNAITSTMFVPPRDPAREVWTGARLGTAGVTERTGMRARPFDELLPALDSLLRGASALHAVGDLASGANFGTLPRDAQIVAAVRERFPSLRVTDATPIVAALRGVKSPAELALIRKAVDITVTAHQEAMSLVAPGLNEFEAQALIEYTFRRNGADRPGFASIVGSGPNSTTLHYNANGRFMEAGDVVVIDIGASYRGYTADVTRTLPVSGTFSPAQRDIYTIVRAAQAAAERQARPGLPTARMNDSATAVIAAGLARLGLIESPGATYDCDTDSRCPQVSLYYMHGLGHGIGLDVHDPDQYAEGRIRTGSVFTIEPGVYVRRDLLSILPQTPRNRALAARIGAAVSKYASIGVRIEDDYIITEQGPEWISRAPRELDEVEAAMRGDYAGPRPRDSNRIEWYRQTQ
jgi:Xaa-Pro aminopeptidase